MQFQIREHKGDYIVEAYIIEDPNSLYGHWFPLRNFGERQGDAILYKNIDCPRLEDQMLRLLIKNYSPEKKYIRKSATQFVVER